MLKKMMDQNLDVKLYEFKYFPHGFLNYDMPNLIPEVSELYQYILNEMEDLITS